MPTAREWRPIIQSALEVALTAEGEPTFPVVPFAPAGLSSTPCAVVKSGGEGLYIDPKPGADFRTVCLATATFTVWLAVGDALTGPASDLLDDLLWLVYSSQLKSARTDPANTGGFIPVLGTSTEPGLTEIGSAVYYAASIPLTVPLK